LSESRKKVAIVGAGFMGKVHAKGYRNIEEAELVAVIDSDTERSAEFSKEFGCGAYSDLNEVLLKEVDFIDVCVPTLFHKNIIIESFKAGKDVICEKPISLSVDEAEEIVEASYKYGRKLMIAHVVRFWPEYYKLSNMIKEGEIKNLNYITFYRYGAPPKWSAGNWMLTDKKSGGIIYDLCIHDIDYSISLFGMPQWVFARSNVINGDYTAYINAILGYKDVNVFIESGFIMPNSYPFTTGFRLSAENMALEYINKNKKGLIMYSNDMETEKRLDYEDFDPYQRELEYFIKCVREDKKPEIGSGEDAIKAVRLAKYIEMSAKMNEKIIIV